MSPIYRVVFAYFLAVTAALTLVSSQEVVQEPADDDVKNLKVGDFFRPQGAAVSGVINSTTPYLRAPCPALNSLANHGHLPRNGRNITRAVLRQAVMTIYNVDSLLAALMMKDLPNVITLADVSVHNDVEHDASFVHADVSYNKDPSEVDVALWEDLASRATKGQLGIKEIGSAARDRIQKCKAKPTGCEYGIRLRGIMFGEAALVLLGLGGNQGESISLEHAKSFFLDERIPSDYKRPEKQVTIPQAAVVAAKIQAEAI